MVKTWKRLFIKLIERHGYPEIFNVMGGIFLNAHHRWETGHFKTEREAWRSIKFSQNYWKKCKLLLKAARQYEWRENIILDLIKEREMTLYFKPRHIKYALLLTLHLTDEEFNQNLHDTFPFDPKSYDNWSTYIHREHWEQYERPKHSEQTDGLSEIDQLMNHSNKPQSRKD